MKGECEGEERVWKGEAHCEGCDGDMLYESAGWGLTCGQEAVVRTYVCGRWV